MIMNISIYSLVSMSDFYFYFFQKKLINYIVSLSYGFKNLFKYKIWKLTEFSIFRSKLF
jgi:hypothetical protein